MSTSRKGWTDATLARLRVGVEHGRFVFRLEDEAGEPCGVLRYADDGRQPKAKADAGTVRQLWPAPEKVPGDVLLVVEGEPDAVTATQLGYAAVAIPGVSADDDAWPRRLARERKRVHLYCDADSVGRARMKLLAARVALYGCDARVVDPFPSRDDHSDLSDLVVAFGPDAARGVVDDAIAWAERVHPGDAAPPAPGVAEPAPARDVLRHPDLSLARPVRWAWDKRVALAKLGLLVGNEGVGKGTLLAWLAAGFTRGTLAGDLYGTPARVLIVGDEDALEDTWTPRLHVADADFARVAFPPEDVGDLDVTTSAGLDRLRSWIAHFSPDVVFFDALMDHLGDVDEYKPKAVRGALRPVARTARDTGAAIVGSLHPKKGEASSFRDLLAASHQFNAVSRSSLLLAQHPESETRRVLARGKGNLSAPPTRLEFAIESAVFEHAGRTFNQPVTAAWSESDVELADLMPRRQREATQLEATIESLEAIAPQVSGDGWPPRQLAEVIGTNPQHNTFKRALGELVKAGAWTVTGATRNRLYRPAVLDHADSVPSGLNADLQGKLPFRPDVTRAGNGGLRDDAEPADADPQVLADRLVGGES